MYRSCPCQEDATEPGLPGLPGLPELQVLEAQPEEVLGRHRFLQVLRQA